MTKQTTGCALVAVCLAVLSAHAEPISIQGQVVDTSQGSPTPVEGVWVSLANLDAGDSTDANGEYHITGDTRALPHTARAPLSLSAPVFRGTVLRFPVEHSNARVSIAVYSLLGRQVESILDERMKRGVYTVDIGGFAHADLPSALYLVGLRVDGKAYFHRLLNVQHRRMGGAGAAMAAATVPSVSVAKAAAPAVDTLVVLQVATATEDTLAYTRRSIISFVGTMPDIVLCIGCDTDGDGLPDDREIHAYRTNPRQADTDGDGWNDYEELLQFSPPARFNPVIADLPSVEVVIEAPPEVGLNWTSSSGTSSGSEVVVGGSSSFEQSTSTSFGKSIGIEHGWMVKGELGYNVALLGGEVSGTYSYETTTEWGYSESRANARSWARAESMQESESITYTDGYIAVPAYIRNNSAIGYTVNDIQLAAYKLDYDDESGFEHVSHLTLEGLGSGFTVPPGGMAGPFDFSNSLSVGEARALVVDAEAFMTKLTAHNISMTDGETVVDFTHEYTTAAARTALVRIDFGPGAGRKPVMYRVATKIKYNENHAGLFDMYFPYYLSDAMREMDIDYATDSVDGHLGLSEVEGVGNDGSQNAYWFVYHTTPEDTMLVSLKDSSYTSDFDSIAIDAYHTVEIFFSRDRDNDGVPERTEEMIGTSDTLEDSDGDGLTDREEIVGWHDGTTTWKTDPLCEDTDGDGVIDPDDDDPLARPLGVSAVIGAFTMVDPDHAFTMSCDSQLTSFTVADTFPTSLCSLQVSTHEIAGRVSVVRRGRHNTITLDSVPCTDTRELLYECVIPMGINENELEITVVSEHGGQTQVYTFSDIMAPLRVPDWEVKPHRPGSYKSLMVRAADYGELIAEQDGRVDGLMVVGKPYIANTTTVLAPRYQFNYSVGDTLYALDTVRVLDVRTTGDIDENMYEFVDTNLVPGTQYWYTLYSFGEVDDTIFYTGLGGTAPRDTFTTNSVRVTPFVTDLTPDDPACSDPIFIGCEFIADVWVNGVLTTSEATGYLKDGAKKDFNDTAASVVLRSPGGLSASCNEPYSAGSETVIRVVSEIGVPYGGMPYGPATQRFVYEWPRSGAIDSEVSGCAQNMVENFTGHIYSGVTFRRFRLYSTHEYNLDKYVTIGMGFKWEYVE